MNTDFTAEMENGLDTISTGDEKMAPFLDRFFLGHDGYEGLKSMTEGEIDAREAATVPVGVHEGKPLNVRVGRYGPFIEYDGKTANVPEDMAPDSLRVEDALRMIEEQAKGPTPLGTDPETLKPVYVLTGRYGPYVQLGDREPDEVGTDGKKKKGKKPNKPKMKSLLAGMVPEEMDLTTALALLSLPKELGVWGKTGEPITKDLGRFGPYVKSGAESRSIPKDKNLLDLTLEEAVELLNTPKRGRGRAGKTILKELGKDPKTEKPIQLLDGKYGPYVSDGKTNASLPKGTDPEACTLEVAIELLEAKKD
ncbi:MAG: topoisomerase protein [Parcubacteria group bacterium GW2011_GWA2_53_21]|nr:MAG: topoisomerase protein [Parcubacteria group bacterium GW2011_GWA2_53_21]